MKHEHIIQAQMIEQEVEQLNQQLKLIEENSKELLQLQESLDELEKKQSEDLFVNIGKRIFLPVKLRDNTLLVDVGKNNLVKKSLPEIKTLIEKQRGSLSEGKGSIIRRLEELDASMELLLRQIEQIKE